VNDGRTRDVILEFTSSAASGEDALAVRAWRDEQQYYRSPLAAKHWDVRLPKLFSETLGAGTDWRREISSAESAKQRGHQLWSGLPDPVRQMILHPGSPDLTKIALVRTGSGVDDLPWEWLNDNENPLAVQGSIRLVRLVPSSYPAPPLTIPLPIRVLLVLASPDASRVVDGRREIDVVEGALRNSALYECKAIKGWEHGEIEKALAWAPHIFHYLGYAGISGTRGSLLLHDMDRGTRWMPATELAAILPPSVRLVCLSTYVGVDNYELGGFMKFAQSPAEIPLPTTIVNQHSLDRGTATEFWKEFYPQLTARNGNVTDAFHFARVAAWRASGETCSWASFSLVIRDGSGHPFRLSEGGDQEENRFAAEVQAQWAARMANTLAVRMRPLQGAVQEQWQNVLQTEIDHIKALERKISGVASSREIR